MIDTVKQLNEFVASEGLETQSQILPRLIERKELISLSLAKLILKNRPLKLT